MKPRVLYADAFPALDFEKIERGTPLYLDGEKAIFAGDHDGSVWLKVKRKTVFMRKTNPALKRLKLTP